MHWKGNSQIAGVFKPGITNIPEKNQLLFLVFFLQLFVNHIILLVLNPEILFVVLPVK